MYHQEKVTQFFIKIRLTNIYKKYNIKTFDITYYKCNIVSRPIKQFNRTTI